MAIKHSLSLLIFFIVNICPDFLASEAVQINHTHAELLYMKEMFQVLPFFMWICFEGPVLSPPLSLRKLVYVHSANIQLRQSLLLQTNYTITGRVKFSGTIKFYLESFGV